MRPFSPVVEALPRSGIREVMEFAAGREGVIHLEVGEPSFATPDHIVDAALAAARAGHTRYTPNAGIPELRRAVAARTAARWGEPVAPRRCWSRSAPSTPSSPPSSPWSATGTRC
jgi:aspartate/methionine/tyrosine aminotransferase